jgi:hypothetical protein
MLGNESQRSFAGFLFSQTDRTTSHRSIAAVLRRCLSSMTKSPYAVRSRLGFVLKPFARNTSHERKTATRER